jgi:hypothetical protein
MHYKHSLFASRFFAIALSVHALMVCLLTGVVLVHSGCSPSSAPEAAKEAPPTPEEAQPQVTELPQVEVEQVPPGFAMEESFDGTATALREKGWNLPAFTTLVSDVPGAKGQALRVDVKDPKQGKYAERYIPVEAGKSYHASVRMRSEGVQQHDNISNNRGAVLFLQLADHDKKYVRGGSFPSGLMGDSDWSEVEVPLTIPIPEDVGYLHVLMGVEGEGTAWFDDLQLAELAPGWAGPEIVRPAMGKTVQTRRPVFEWKPLPLDSVGFAYRLQLSRDPAFPAGETLSVAPLGYQAMPDDWLEPGTWFYRVLVSAMNGKNLPPTAAKSLVVADDAVAWPPTITSSWEWSAEPRPEMAFRIEPEVDTKTEFAVTIDGVPAEILETTTRGIRFRPTIDLAPGAHPVKLTATAPAQKSFVAEGVFSNKPVRKQVSFREDRVMLVDGQPFYPIGTYRDPSDRNDDFNGIQEAGFNITHSYDFEHEGATVEAARAYLDAAQAAGVKVFMGIPRNLFFSRDWNAVQAWVAALMDHPALLLWYLMDEPEANKWKLNPAMLKQLKDTVKAVDPFHPTAVVYFKPDQGDYWAAENPEDIAWHDPYPIGTSEKLTQVGEAAAAQRKAIGAQKPMWTVVQGHDVSYWNDAKGTIQKRGMPTRPTLEETRSMVFQALAAGTDGFIWYWQPVTLYHTVKDTPKVWSGIVATAQLIKKLEPWLLAPARPADSALKVEKPFETWTKEVDGKRLVVLVNTAEKPASLDLDFEVYNPKSVTDYETGAELPLADGRLKADFQREEVKILQLEPSF